MGGRSILSIMQPKRRQINALQYTAKGFEGEERERKWRRSGEVGKLARTQIRFYRLNSTHQPDTHCTKQHNLCSTGAEEKKKKRNGGGACGPVWRKVRGKVQHSSAEGMG